MKVRIKKRFRDIDTMALMLPGQHADYELSRAKKLARSGFVELLEPVVEATEPAVDINANQGDLPISEEKRTTPEGAAAADGQIKETFEEEEFEKSEFTPFPEKVETDGPKKRGRKPKR